jgi:hypothetical protein
MCDRVPLVELVGRWWNRQWGRLARRDIWLRTDDAGWHVQARHGDREVCFDFEREYEARAMVDQLVKAAPGGWKDITRLAAKPAGAAHPVVDPVDEPGDPP